jgi:cytochrome c peroxidase
MKNNIVFVFAFLCLIVILGSSYKKSIKPISKEELGKKLFFDKILSGDNTISCASCHKPELAFADNVALSKGTHGNLTKRNTPSVMNMASRDALFWDGRAATLAEQALFPIKDKNEMNCPIDTAIARLNRHKKYVYYFQSIYQQTPNSTNLGDALGAYESTLETSATANDRWINDLPNGLTEQQLRGRHVFFNNGKCIECHFTPDFTGDEFRNIGLFDGKKYNDSGRYVITKKIEDIGKFKTPGLRNCAITAPYMHDGSFKTLKEVIEYYNNPEDFVHAATPRDSLLMKPLGLTKQEMIDLEAFLNGMTDDAFLPKKIKKRK